MVTDGYEDQDAEEAGERTSPSPSGPYHLVELTLESFGCSQPPCPLFIHRGCQGDTCSRGSGAEIKDNRAIASQIPEEYGVIRCKRKRTQLSYLGYRGKHVCAYDKQEV